MHPLSVFLIPKLQNNNNTAAGTATREEDHCRREDGQLQPVLRQIEGAQEAPGRAATDEPRLQQRGHDPAEFETHPVLGCLRETDVRGFLRSPSGRETE